MGWERIGCSGGSRLVESGLVGVNSVRGVVDGVFRWNLVGKVSCRPTSSLAVTQVQFKGEVFVGGASSPGNSCLSFAICNFEGEGEVQVQKRNS